MARIVISKGRKSPPGNSGKKWSILLVYLAFTPGSRAAGHILDMLDRPSLFAAFPGMSLPDTCWTAPILDTPSATAPTLWASRQKNSPRCRRKCVGNAAKTRGRSLTERDCRLTRRGTQYRSAANGQQVDPPSGRTCCVRPAHRPAAAPYSPVAGRNYPPGFAGPRGD